MRAHARAAATLTAGWLAIAACSKTEERPPDLGDCTSVDGAACARPITGTGAGTTEGGSGTCAVDAGAGQCDGCLAASCCAVLAACDANLACSNLVSCEQGCNLAASCISACQGQYPGGVTDLQAIVDCQALRCPICAESGAGDPCSAGYGACIAGLTCNGLWCTRPCARSSDCAGIGAGGANVLGLPGACASTGAGEQCVPECGSTADCADFPATFCRSTTDVEGSMVSVCAPLPDASTD